MTKSSGKLSRLFRSLADGFVWSFVLPTPRAVWVLAAGALFIPLGFALGLGWLPFWLYNGLFLALTIVDFARLPAAKSVRANRTVPDRAEQGIDFEVGITITLDAPVSYPLEVEAADDLPLSFQPHTPLRGTFREEKSRTFTYTTRAAERGDHPLRFLYIRYSGFMGLWTRQLRLPVAQTVKVYPDLSGVRGILASVQESLILEGRKLHRKSPSGMEFHYIRDYTPDDDPRTVNWMSSARTGKLQTNVRQPERGKIVTLLIDCGRLMGVELEGQSKLDRTIESALCLAAVALKQGDQVAVLLFSGHVRAYVPPGKGNGYLQTILEALYAQQNDTAESNYGCALEYLLRYQRKRSLIVLFSDMENYLFEDELIPLMLKVRRTHPVFLLSLEDPVLTDWTRIEAANLQQAYARSAAQTFRLDRKRFVGRMSGLGIKVLDVPADRLTLAAVNQYLELKSRESI